MAGYTRQSNADIISGLPITAGPIARELNKLAEAFNGATGHAHDGSIGGGPKLDLATSIQGVLQVANGGVGGLMKLDATTDPLQTDDSVAGYAKGSLWLNTLGPRLFVCTNATANSATWVYISLISDIGQQLPNEPDTVDLGSAALRYKTLFIGDLNASAGAYFTGAVEAAQGFTGDLAGNVTGNLTGNVTGDLTGNLNAPAGTTTVDSLVVNGTIDVTNARIQNVATPTSSTDAANRSYVDTVVAELLDSAPGTLDTLNELAAALGDDPNFATTVSNELATKLPKAGGEMSGAIDMGQNPIINLPSPVNANDAVGLGYIVELFGSTASAAMSAALAQEWASKPENQEVTNGLFSAKHYSIKSANSAVNSAASESAAATSATQANDSKNAAATSEANAETFANSAATSADDAAESLNEFYSVYLGPYASDPAVDNNGDPLVEGTLYYNTTSNTLRAYNGSQWAVFAVDQGPDSGLDADTVDGIQAANLFKLDQANTTSGDITISKATPALTLSDDGPEPDAKISYSAGETRIDTDTLYIRGADGGDVADFSIFADGGVRRVLHTGDTKYVNFSRTTVPNTYITDANWKGDTNISIEDFVGMGVRIQNFVFISARFRLDNHFQRWDTDANASFRLDIEQLCRDEGLCDSVLHDTYGTAVYRPKITGPGNDFANFPFTTNLFSAGTIFFENFDTSYFDGPDNSDTGDMYFTIGFECR